MNAPRAGLERSRRPTPPGSGTNGALAAEGGFTVLEAVIALALVLFAMAMATGVLSQATDVFRRFDPAKATTAGPSFAFGVLRNDLRAGRRVLNPGVLPDLWEREALRIGGGPLGEVRYELLAGNLIRTVGGLDPIETRVLLTEVTSLRWRLAGPGLVDLELTYRPPVLDQGSRQARRRAAETQALRIALRGTGRGRIW